MGDQDRESLDSILDALEEEFSRKERERKGSEVYLNVYDMIWVNDYTSRFGIGAFHSGVEVHRRGVYDIEPKSATEVAGPGLKFRESVLLGHTPLTARQVGELVLSIGKEFNGNDYHIFNKNCNHFSEELSMKLTGSHIPKWINRLAYVSSWMPFILNCLPPAWVTPTGEVEGQRAQGCLFSTCSKSPHSKSDFQHLDSPTEDEL